MDSRLDYDCREQDCQGSSCSLPSSHPITCPPLLKKPLLTPDPSIDRGAAILGVHLFGHHVLSVLLLGPRTGPRSYLDRGGRWLGLVHFPDSLVSKFHKARLQMETNKPKGVLSPTSRGSRCLRPWPDALLQLEMGLVCHGRHVSTQQHLHSGKLVPTLKLQF